MSGPDLVERLKRVRTIGDFWDIEDEVISALSTLREQAAHYAAMSNRDALAALKLESERDALRSRCETLEERLATAYRVKAECNDTANEERRLRLAAESARDEAVRALERADPFEHCATEAEEQAELLLQMTEVYPGDPTGHMARDARKLLKLAASIRSLKPRATQPSGKENGDV